MTSPFIVIDSGDRHRDQVLANPVRERLTNDRSRMNYPLMNGKRTIERARAWRQRHEDAGRVKVELWVPAEQRETFRWLAQQAQDGARLDTQTAKGLLRSNLNGDESMTDTAWTDASLLEALAGGQATEEGELTARLIEGVDPALMVTMHLYGDLEIFLSAQGEQVLASVLLWPVKDQPEKEHFNDFLLRTHKTLPLSTFGITTVDGQDYYELFGALSSRSVLASVVEELRTLASNAIEMVEDLHPATQTEAA